MTTNFTIGDFVINFGVMAIVAEIFDNGDLLLEGYGKNTAGQKWRADPTKCISAH